MASHFAFEAIGTSWKIDISETLDPAREKALLNDIRVRIAEFDKAYSRFRDDSLVSHMAKKSGNYSLPDDAVSMLSLYKELYDLSGGRVTPLVGQVLSDAGYDATYSLKPKSQIPPAKRWEDVLSFKAKGHGGHPSLALKEPALLDFGALGKGYLIDIVADIIRGRGIETYTVDAGGDIAYSAGSKPEAKPLRVGLEDPQDPKKVVGLAHIGGIGYARQSVCGSAGNRRVWDRFHHIIDPIAVESPRHILGLWTVADTTLLADAMATALFFIEPEKLLSYRFEYAIVFADRSAVVSKGFPGKFFG